MQDLKKMFMEICEEIKETTELFYQQKEHAGYQKLDKTLLSVSNGIECLFATLKEENPPEFDQNEILNILNNAMNAMQVKDTVLLADILQYDLLEQFESIIKQI